jgi:tripartite-type tricarboxylate transporter receptor subunit TctC
MTRRCAGFVIALAVTCSGVHAQTFPAQDLHIVCAYPAGSSSDAIARFIAEKIRPAVGRTILVENKPGANGNIATEFAARASVPIPKFA